MTHEEQAELRKTLVALGGLITQLMPEDDLQRLALDPKRVAAAAQMVGAVSLAGNLIRRALDLCESNGVVPKRASAHTGSRTAQWIVRRLERAPGRAMSRNKIGHAVTDARVASSSGAYYALYALKNQGRIKIDK